MAEYILSIDQSTQGTKGLLFDRCGGLVARADRPHRQIVNERGWVEHDPEEILANTLSVCRAVAGKAKIDPSEIRALGISNQRETVVGWSRATGKPIYNAIVWQCARGQALCERLADQADEVRKKSGLPLSPYFSAAKLGWLMENVPEAAALQAAGQLCLGTMDSYLLYALTREHVFQTDYSNASRTQLFNIHTLCWDDGLCAAFGVPKDALAEVRMSDSLFGHTDLGGWLKTPIPIHGVLGDSHGALFGQDCRRAGQCKATYGTGSSVMMHTGGAPRESRHGLATSLAWGMDGKVNYVLEGNINYTGAVISWLKNDLQLIDSDAEATELARRANPADRTYCVPAFSGLGAPHWDSGAAGLLTGMTRTTGRAEIVRAALDCIAYQVTDLVQTMRADSDLPLDVLRVDGGPTASDYLMQLQSDIADVWVQVPALQELSGMGAAYAAGIAVGLYDRERVFQNAQRTAYHSQMEQSRRDALLFGWQQAVRQALTHP